MTPTLIKYSQEFKSIEGNRWLGIEIPVPPGEDPLDTFKKAEVIVNQAFHGEQVKEVVREVQVEKMSKDNFLKGMAEDIKKCETFDQLESFKTVVFTYPELEGVYTEKLKELS